MKKRIFGGMAVLLAIATTCVAYARYSMINSFYAEGDIYDDYAYAEVVASFKEMTDVTATLYLQKSTDNGKSYQTCEIIASKSDFQKMISLYGDTSDLNENYKYRIKAEVVVDGGETEYKYLY